MPMLLSHYRPDLPIYAFTENRAVQRRLALYHGVTAIHLKFLPDADGTFERCALSHSANEAVPWAKLAQCCLLLVCWQR